jgi:protocatechuate 3,4-dioxygenase beta subunit
MWGSRVALLAASALVASSVVAAPAFAAPVAAPPTPGGVSGTITTNAEATPVVGATVYLRSAKADFPIDALTAASVPEFASAVTNAEGAYSFANVTPGRYNVVVAAAGLATPSAGFTAALVRPGQTTTKVDLDLVPSATITGVIKDAGGQPIGGATVFAINNTLYDLVNNWPTNGANLQDVVQAYYTIFGALGVAGWQLSTPGVAVTAADGTYTIDGLAPSATYLVQTVALGHVAPASTTVAITNTGTADFTYPAGATVHGKVTLSDGTPIEGVVVTDSSLIDVADPGLPWPTEAVTAADGTYSITGFAASATPQFSVTKAGVSLPDWQAPVISSATSNTQLDFASPGDGSITGTVTDQFGNPVVNKQVLISGSFSDVTAVTDSTGHYSASGLANDSYIFQLLAIDGVSATPDSVTVSDAAKNVTHDIAATRQARISGYVHNSEGAPVFGAFVSVRSSGGQTLRQGITGPDGSYDIPTLDPGSYTVVAEVRDAAANLPVPLSVDTVGQDQGLDIALRPLSAASVPDAPHATVIPGVESLLVANLVQTGDGGNPITKFVVTVSPGGYKCESSFAACNIKGLRDDTQYTVKITAVNQVGASLATTKIVRTKFTAAVTAIKVKSLKGGKALVTFKAPHTTDVIKDYTLHYLAKGKWQVYKHKATAKSVISVSGLPAKETFKAYITPVLKSGRAANSAYFSLRTG